ncbi:unknown similar to AMEV028 [Choristoneura rosaceana entomopoxvirus 'L']|uniref:Uncharacterized protein n=1 Tax=Choristoneura rosaceana entomopoxvirus 'L' TaxID=1293539 RepID=A0ABM9QK63_9POXV|nr:unknown similar to AMEV028 [Choristoneura rosaceana entomopoxvirus 'L']CCU55931.1 unknown similar to AMEV028 [Choristoneura rosaceana entomopoxvirus 'L']
MKKYIYIIIIIIKNNMDIININTYIDNNIYIKYISNGNKYNTKHIPAILISKENFNKDIYIEAYSNLYCPKYIFTNNKNFTIKYLNIIDNKCQFKIIIDDINYDFIIGFYIYDIYNYIKKYDPLEDIVQEIYDNKIYVEKYIEYALMSNNNKIKFKKIRYIPYYNFYNLNNYILY